MPSPYDRVKHVLDLAYRTRTRKVHYGDNGKSRGVRPVNHLNLIVRDRSVGDGYRLSGAEMSLAEEENDRLVSAFEQIASDGFAVLRKE